MPPPVLGAGLHWAQGAWQGLPGLCRKGWVLTPPPRTRDSGGDVSGSTSGRSRTQPPGEVLVPAACVASGQWWSSAPGPQMWRSQQPRLRRNAVVQGPTPGASPGPRHTDGGVWTGAEAGLAGSAGLLGDPRTGPWTGVKGLPWRAEVGAALSKSSVPRPQRATLNLALTLAAGRRRARDCMSLPGGPLTPRRLWSPGTSCFTGGSGAGSPWATLGSPAPPGRTGPRAPVATLALDASLAHPGNPRQLAGTAWPRAPPSELRGRLHPPATARRGPLLTATRACGQRSVPPPQPAAHKREGLVSQSRNYNLERSRVSGGCAPPRVGARFVPASGGGRGPQHLALLRRRLLCLHGHLTSLLVRLGPHPPCGGTALPGVTLPGLGVNVGLGGSATHCAPSLP